MSKLHLWREKPSEAEDLVTAGASLVEDEGRRRLLWYRLPRRFYALPDDSLDAFVIGSIFTAMREARDLVVHGRVSKVLLDNLDEFQIAWSNWRPEKYSRIDIEADAETQEHECRPSNEALVAFSGGLDAAFTTYRHSRGLCGRANRVLKAGVFIHGLDILLERRDIFDSAAERAKLMLESLGLELIPITTNFRELGDTFIDSHGAGIASSMHLLAGYCSTGLISSSKPYADLVLPWGSNPVTDRYLSSDRFQVVHDAAGYTRSEKIDLVSEWEAALRYLRVCWKTENLDRNCCQCQKCIRTILDLRAHGVGLPECFESDVSDEMILEMKGLDSIGLSFFEEILSRARARGMSGSWMKALQKTIQKNRKAQSGWCRWLRELRDRRGVRTTSQG